MNKEDLTKDLITPIGDNEEEYLYDESKIRGVAYSISFPQTNEEVSQIIKKCKQTENKITIQGALTGIVGAGVPVCGHIMNMTKMNKFLRIIERDEMYIEVEPGMSIQELEKVIRKETNNQYIFPVIPTEKTATIGGAISSGSNGLQSYYYGNIRNYIKQLEICNCNGEFITVTKEDELMSCEICCEGMIGVITKATLQLVKKPADLWGIMFMFENDKQACDFVDSILSINDIVAIEYIDRNTIDIIEKFKGNMSAISSLPDIDKVIQALIYVEIKGDSEETLEENVTTILEKCIEVGGNPDVSWAMSSETEIEVLRSYRHAASECVNMIIGENNFKDERIKKMSADIKWKKKTVYDIITYYKNSLKESNLNGCIFGHIGMLQPYVNIIAATQEEYENGKQLMKRWIADAYSEGGEVFKEHGIGKLKKEYFCEFASIESINHLVKLKLKWDSEDMFNPKNMFSTGTHAV